MTCMLDETHTESASSNGGVSSGGAVANAQEKASRVAGEVPAQASKVAHDVKTQLRETTTRTLSDVRIRAHDRATRAA